MAVSNPFYRRIAQNHPERDARGNRLHSDLNVEATLALLRAKAVGEMTEAEMNEKFGQISGYQDADGVYVPVPLDATELQQANDLIATVLAISTPSGTTALLTAQRAEGKADRAMLLVKVRETLMMLQTTGGVLPGWTVDDMAGAVVNGAAGGKLNVPRRDGP